MSDKIKLLYVDDEIPNLELFKIHFGHKYEILTARDAFDGLETLEANPETQVIISDMKMPKLNGLEFIQRAKAEFPSKKYYILTGFQITREIEAALKSGLIIKYFSKPFDIDEINHEIEKVLNDNE